MLVRSFRFSGKGYSILIAAHVKMQYRLSWCVCSSYIASFYWITYNIPMKTDQLRSIGESLLREIPLMKKRTLTPLGIGAAGDRTYAIDKVAEDVIIQGLEATGEPLTIVSEESGILTLHGGGLTVLIDPVDGSRNAVCGIPFYCTSIAVAAGDTIGDVKSAYIVNLVTGDEFWAEAGSGAYKNSQRISVQQDDDLNLVAYEAQSPQRDIPHIMPLLAASRKTRCLGATALDLAYLADGAISVFTTPSPSRSFDFAGGWLLVKEAGGTSSDLDGNNIENTKISLERSTSLLVAGNKKLHTKALHLLQRG